MEHQTNQSNANSDIAIQYNTLHTNTAQHNTTEHSTTQHITTQYNTIQRNTHQNKHDSAIQHNINTTEY